jgi:hypothetical protein
MAMTPAALKTLIKTNLEAAFGAPADPSMEDKFADALSQAIVTFLTTNAVVNATGVDPQGGTVTSTGTLS